jgi:hypothetical protein
MSRIAVELISPIVDRALEPFPVAVRTPDALHLATVGFLREQRQVLTLATCDDRMRLAARKMRIPLYPL